MFNLEYTSQINNCGKRTNDEMEALEGFNVEKKGKTRSTNVTILNQLSSEDIDWENSFPANKITIVLNGLSDQDIDWDNSLPLDNRTVIVLNGLSDQDIDWDNSSSTDRRRAIVLNGLSDEDIDWENSRTSVETSTDETPSIESFVFDRANPFFKGKVKHPTREIQILFLRIISQIEKKEPHHRIEGFQLIKAYEKYVSVGPQKPNDEAYCIQSEQNFLERILSVFLKTGYKFDADFDFAKRGLLRGSGNNYFITASKLKNFGIAIEGNLIDTILAAGLTKKEFIEITQQTYLSLHQYV